MAWSKSLAFLACAAITCGAEPPSRDWQPRYREFVEIAEQPPYSDTVKARIIELLSQEAELMLALDEAGESGTLGEGYGEYVSDLSELVFRFARRGDRAAALALIRSAPPFNSVISRWLVSHYWREILSFEMNLTPRAQMLYTYSIGRLGVLLRDHGEEIEPDLRRQMEERIINGLTSEDPNVEYYAIGAARAAKLKAALPRLREIEARMRAGFRGSPPEKHNLNRILKAIEELEKLP